MSLFIISNSVSSAVSTALLSITYCSLQLLHMILRLQLPDPEAGSYNLSE